MRRGSTPPFAVPRGEKVLAWAAALSGGAVGGTRDALYLVVPSDSESVRIPWEQVEAAEWNADDRLFRVSEIGTWGTPRPLHAIELEDASRLLQLVRERVTASIVLQRGIAVAGRRGVRILARRAPRGDLPVTWMCEYDEGVDPDDPEVTALVDAALAEARAEVGLD